MSSFVKKSNNHFGIKCHSDWKGARVYHDDDNPNDCFRKYKKVEDSFEDHSLFLTQKPRYAPLFKLNIRDYKAWSKGLQKTGYATDKAYANKLIKIIEVYELYIYDNEGAVDNKQAKKAKELREKEASEARKKTEAANKRQEKEDKEKKKNKGVKTNAGQETANKTPIYRDVFKTHGLIYVIANDGDTFDQIASDMRFNTQEMLNYNEVPKEFPLYNGDIVYLEAKKIKADRPYYEHLVQIGESMHGISQRYGMQVKSIYKLNGKDEDYVPEEGDVLRLR
ncbi:N-acetylmuramoyl-L-alanine amidase [Bacteroidales bacterium]|nr:N-acetylmuramoyl-L-alanine amidase [Bacteroidales bacterium]